MSIEGDAGDMKPHLPCDNTPQTHRFAASHLVETATLTLLSSGVNLKVRSLTGPRCGVRTVWFWSL